MSDSPKDRGDWSSASDSLFRTARRAHDPTAKDRARVDAALARTLAGQSPASFGRSTAIHGGSPQVGRALGLGKIAKVALGVLFVAVGSFAVIRATTHPDAPPHRPPRAAGAAASRPAQPAQPPPVPARVDSTLPVSQRASMAAHPAGDEREWRVRRAKLHPRAHASNTRKHSVQAASAADVPSSVRVRQSVPDPGRSALPAPRPASPSASGATTARNASGASAASATQDRTTRAAGEIISAKLPDDARAELAVVERMQAALRRADFSAALTLCAQHERRWPHGMFELERDGVRAIAACGARSNDASARAKRFLASNPHAPVAMRVRTACSEQLSSRQAP